MMHTLNNETKVLPSGVTLHQLVAGKDIPLHGVRQGDVGGWVESPDLVQDDAWVSGEAQVFGDARVIGHARVAGNARVYGDARVTGHARVAGNAQVSGNARVAGNARVFGHAWVFLDAQVDGNAQVYGDALVSESALVFGHARVAENARVSGGARVCGNAHVSGYAQVSGDARVDGNARVAGAALVFAPQDVLVMGPIGSESVYATLHRSLSGHDLHVGCWEEGQLDTLMDEVERRAIHWTGADAEKARWVAEYQAFHALGTIRVQAWSKTPARPAPGVL